MCAIRRVSNNLCGEWKLKRALQDMEAPAQSFAFFLLTVKTTKIFAHKGKSNTSFGTVKGLLLFVCTHNRAYIVLFLENVSGLSRRASQK